MPVQLIRFTFLTLLISSFGALAYQDLAMVEVLDKTSNTNDIDMNKHDSADIIDVNSWLLGASLGYGEITSHLTDEDDIGLYVLPDIRYYGEKFYFENSTLGYSLAETPRYSVELLGRVNLDGLVFPEKYRNVIAAFASQLSSRNFLGDLGPQLPQTEEEPVLYPQEKQLSYMVGAVARWYLPYSHLSWSVTKDVTAGHYGIESQLSSVSYFQLAQVSLELQLALNYKSQRLTNYYYGVDESALPTGFDYLQYKPDAALNWHAQIQMAYPISESWFLVTSLRYEAWHSEITQSPIVKQDASLAYFSGIKWVY